LSLDLPGIVEALDHQLESDAGVSWKHVLLFTGQSTVKSNS